MDRIVSKISRWLVTVKQPPTVFACGIFEDNLIKALPDSALLFDWTGRSGVVGEGLRAGDRDPWAADYVGGSGMHPKAHEKGQRRWGSYLRGLQSSNHGHPCCNHRQFIGPILSD